jgi:hypothetical protein
MCRAIDRYQNDEMMYFLPPHPWKGFYPAAPGLRIDMRRKRLNTDGIGICCSDI